jgi:NAD+ diphosphatase
MNDFSRCPRCGSDDIENENNRKWFCPSCGFELYNNVAAAVGLVIADSEGAVLFERRAKDPRKGYLAFPGGFVDPDETAEAAAVRECREETGVAPLAVDYLCSFPNTYEYRGIVYKTCDLFFTAVLPDTGLTAQPEEVLGFERRKICTRSDLDELPLAFESARKTLAVWLDK